MGCHTFPNIHGEGRPLLHKVNPLQSGLEALASRSGYRILFFYQVPYSRYDGNYVYKITSMVVIPQLSISVISHL